MPGQSVNTSEKEGHPREKKDKEREKRGKREVLFFALLVLDTKLLYFFRARKHTHVSRHRVRREFRALLLLLLLFFCA